MWPYLAVTAFLVARLWVGCCCLPWHAPFCHRRLSPTAVAFLCGSAPCTMQVMSLLGWTKPGPQLGKVMAAVMDWQLMNPSATAEQAEEMVRQRFGSAAQ